MLLKLLIVSLISMPLVVQAEDSVPAAYRPTKEDLAKKELVKAQRDEEEKKSSIARNKIEKDEYFNYSYSKVIDRGIEDIRKACADDDLNYRQFRESNSNINECIQVISPKVNKLKADLRSKKVLPESCSQWALTKVPEWSNPKFYMEYNPIVQNKTPVSFSGQIQDGNNKSLSLAHKQDNDFDGKYAIITLGKHTYFVNPDKVTINRNISGVGTPVGAQRVKLMNGTETTIPIIQAECIE